MQIAFAARSRPNSGTWVVLAAGDGRLGAVGAELDERVGGAIGRAIGLAGAAFKRGTTVDLVCPGGAELDRVVVLSLGALDELAELAIEKAGASVAVKLEGLGVADANVAVDALEGAQVAPVAVATALAAGASLRTYRFEKYRTDRKSDDEPDVRLAQLTLHLDDPDGAAGAWEPTAAIATGVAHGRDLVTEPANVLTPEAFADQCRELGGALGLEVEILDETALAELGMNALLAVNQGSVRKPRVAVMRWSGGPAGEPPVALVGKGVCFDSGGLSLKPAGSMEDMKWDMGGAGAVFGAMKAIAGRKAKANVVGVLGLVENMPSGEAQRPGDVITAMSGLTIEVLNTDAEGRLVLADLLHYTADRIKPKAMVDLATLTGAIVVALGSEKAGLFTPDDDLADRLTAAGAAVDEPLWRMPLGEDYDKHIKSEIADIKNVGRSRQAGATAGAVFLQRFVGEVPWAHLDIAGVTWAKEAKPLGPKGATGFGIRLLDRLIADHYEG